MVVVEGLRLFKLATEDSCFDETHYIPFIGRIKSMITRSKLCVWVSGLVVLISVCRPGVSAAAENVSPDIYRNDWRLTQPYLERLYHVKEYTIWGGVGGAVAGAFLGRWATLIGLSAAGALIAHTVSNEAEVDTRRDSLRPMPARVQSKLDVDLDLRKEGIASDILSSQGQHLSSELNAVIKAQGLEPINRDFEQLKHEIGQRKNLVELMPRFGYLLSDHEKKLLKYYFSVRSEARKDGSAAATGK